MADTVVVLTVKRILVSVVKSPLRSLGKVKLVLRMISRPFLAGSTLRSEVW